MELLEAVKRSQKKTRARGTVTSWANVKKLMGGTLTAEQYRAKYRVQYGDQAKSDKMQKVKLSADRSFKKGITDPIEILLDQLLRERTIEELCYATSMTEIEVLGNIEQLRIKGYSIINIHFGDTIAYKMDKIVKETYYEFKHYQNVDKTIKFAIISDTHIGSNYWQPSYLEMAYDDFVKEGITNVYHAGDITDGMYSNRAGNIYEIHSFGTDQQVDEVVDRFPQRDGITTYFITGNHDATHMMNGGANIGKAIARERKDLVYLGHEYAKIWLTENVDMDIVHPRDGSSYALSYRLQRKIDAMSGGSKPKILVSGHYHKNLYLFYRNIHAYLLASFQAQSPFMRGKGLVSDLGYMIIELKVNHEGDIIEINGRYKPFYEPIDEKY